MTLQPEVQFVGEVLDHASDTIGVSILPITNYLPSLSVEQTATSSNSSAPTVTCSGATGSPAAILSAETLSADNANCYDRGEFPGDTLDRVRKYGVNAQELVTTSSTRLLMTT